MTDSVYDNYKKIIDANGGVGKERAEYVKAVTQAAISIACRAS
jgi:hypothetical protein